MAKVLSDIVPLLHTAAPAADAIKYVFSELGRNVLEHANSEIGAFICAQYYRDTNRIAVGIADSGRGVFSSIRRSHHVATSPDAIFMALTPGISGATPKIGGNETNAGAGLYFIKSLANLSKNYFMLFSGDTLFKLCPSDGATLSPDPKFDRHKIVSGLPRWNGTVIGVDIAVQKEQTFAGLIDQIRQSYKLDLKQRKKDYFKGIRFR